MELMRRLMLLWFHCLVLVTPFLFTAINDELFEFNKMLFVYLLTIAMTATWAVWSIRSQKILWKNHVLLPVIGIFLMSQVISTIFSIHTATSIFGYYSRFHGGLLSTVCYLAILQIAVSTLRAQDVPALVRSAIWGTIGVCLYAIPEHFGVSPSCLLITGTADVSCWVQDVQSRVFATFGQPNWLAAYLLVMIPLMIWYFLREAQEKIGKTMAARAQRYIPIVGLSLAIATLSFTQSRSGYYGFLVGVAVLMFCMVVGWFQRKTTPGGETSSSALPYQRLIPVGLALAVPIFIFGLGHWTGLEKILQNVGGSAAIEEPTVATGTQLETGGTDSGKIRLIVWKGALKVWQRYPIFGSGVETFAYSYYQDRIREHNDISEWDFLYNKAHNEFLNFLATTGIVGLVAYCGLIAVPAYLYIKDGVLNQKASWRTWLTASCWLAASAGLAVSNFFGFSTVMVGVLFFLMPAFWIVLTSGDEQEDEFVEDWENLSLPQWGAVAIVALAAVVGVWNVVQAWQNDTLLAKSKSYLAAGMSQDAFISVQQLTTRQPNEPLFWEQRAVTMAQLAVGVAASDATTAAQLAYDADASSLTMLQLNDRHINFWKSRVRTLLYLGTLDEGYLEDAIVALSHVRNLAPTDSKITYNLALIYETLGRTAEAEQAYQDTLLLRPHYEDAIAGYERLKQEQEATPGPTLSE